MTRRETCRLCEAPEPQLALALTPTPVADAYLPEARANEVQEVFPLELYLCRQCGHLQLLHVVDSKILFENYIYVSSSSLGLLEHFRKLSEGACRRFQVPADSLVVDIGSNEGSLLRCFQSQGMRVLGVDPAREIARKATESGIETWPDFFTKAVARRVRETHGAASVITATNVFAHSDQLADMADGIREFLAPAGVFIFEVGYMVDLVERQMFDTVYHEHLSYHSVKPLRSFLARHGLELFDVERIASKGGSLRCFAQRLGNGKREILPSVEVLTAMETSRAMGEIGTFEAFAGKIEAAKKSLSGMLSELRRQGKRIAGYGASPSVTTLIYHFELGPLLDYIVDDNPAKQKTLSPGLHIPVLPPAALAERKPDYVLILAWPYAEAILKKNQPYAAAGGRFILPFPAPQIL